MFSADTVNGVRIDKQRVSRHTRDAVAMTLMPGIRQFFLNEAVKAEFEQWKAKRAEGMT